MNDAQTLAPQPPIVDDSLQQQAQAWFAVVAALDAAAPGWYSPGLQMRDCAVRAIGELAAARAGVAA